MSYEVYVKEGRRYRKLGINWCGFPSNGVWLVHEGSQSLIMKVGDVVDPMPLANMMKYKDKACKALGEFQESCRLEGFWPSTNDSVNCVLMAVAKAEELNNRRKI